MPALVNLLSTWHPRGDSVYQLIASILSIYIGYAIIQSILAYTDLWGIKYPDWLNKWLESEIKDKEGKMNTTNKQDSTDINQK